MWTMPLAGSRLGQEAAFWQVPSNMKDMGRTLLPLLRNVCDGPPGGWQWLKPQKEGEGTAAFWTLVLGGWRLGVGESGRTYEEGGRPRGRSQDEW